MKRIAYAVALQLAVSPAQGGTRSLLKLGGDGGLRWADAGTVSFIDTARPRGGIAPFRTDLSQNLAAQLRGRGGGVVTTSATEAIPTDWREGRFRIVDGDSTTAFVHEPQINIYGGAGRYYTVDMRFDLGAPFPVERIRLRTRPTGAENLLRVYRLWVNDGSEETRTEFGDLLWTKLRDERDNLNAVVDLEIEPQVVRHIRLRPWETDVTWEIAELEVYGQGFVPQASFQSEAIDLGARSTFGTLGWAGRRDPGAKVVIQTRSGDDDQPEVYWRKTGIGDQEVAVDAKGQPLTRSSYGFLPPNQKGRITQDLDHWSVWKTYEFEDGLTGTPTLSPSPRRFVQLRIEFLSSGTEGAGLDSLVLEYSQPPVARKVVAEIHPDQVQPAVVSRFTYAVRSRLDDGASGFDALRLSAPAIIDSIVEVRIDRQSVAFQAVQPEPGSVSVSFPRIREDQTLLEVDFDAQIFRFGTVFDGAVFDSETDDVPLSAVPGDAVADVIGDGISVRTSLDGPLLAAVRVRPNPFTPNADGVNDQTEISFAVLRLTGAAPVAVEIFDLSGRRVLDLSPGASASGRVSVVWNGQDGSGRALPPGLYLYRVCVEGERGRVARMGPIAVAY